MLRSFALLFALFAAVTVGAGRAAEQLPDMAAVRGALTSLLPDGVRVDSVRIDGKRSTVLGTSPSNAILSNFLRSIDGSANFERVELIQVRAEGGRIDGSANFERVELIQVRAEGGRMAFELSMDITCSTAPNSACLVAEAGAGKASSVPKRASVYKCRVNGALRFQDQPCSAGTESP